MSGKIAVLLFLTFIVFTSCNAMAEKRPCKDGYVTTVEGLAIEGGKGRDYYKKTCRNTECHAAEELACAFEAITGRDIPNTMGRGGPESYYRDLPRYQATIASIGRRHPERIPVYCDLLISMARLDNDSIVGDLETSHHVLEMAARVTRPGNHCIEKVMAALPDTQAIREVVQEVREHCSLKAALCRRMVMPKSRPPP